MEPPALPATPAPLSAEGAGDRPAPSLADRLLHCARQLEPLAAALGETAEALRAVAEHLRQDGTPAGVVRDDPRGTRELQARDAADALRRLYVDVRALGDGPQSPFRGRRQPVRDHAVLTTNLVRALLDGDDPVAATRPWSYPPRESLHGVREAARRIRELTDRSGAALVWHEFPDSRVWNGCDPADGSTFVVAPAVVLGSTPIAPSVVYKEPPVTERPR